jgi:hypothetical protein
MCHDDLVGTTMTSTNLYPYGCFNGVLVKLRFAF